MQDNTNIGFTKRVLVDNINYENLNYDSKYDHKNSTFNYQSIYKNETANKYQNERTIDGGKHVGWVETIHYNVGYQQYYKNDHVNFPYCSSSNSKRKISEIYSPYTNKDSCNTQNNRNKERDIFSSKENFISKKQNGGYCSPDRNPSLSLLHSPRYGRPKTNFFSQQPYTFALPRISLPIEPG